MQVQLRQQLAHFLRATPKQRQNPAFEALLKAPNPRPAYLERAAHRRQPARLATPVAVHRRSIDSPSPLALAPTH